MTPTRTFAVLLAAVLAVACQKTQDNGSATGSGSGSSSSSSATGSGSGAGSGSATPAIDIDSKDILARPAGTGEVYVKHVLIAWKDLAKRLGKRIDPRALNRTNEEAVKLAQDTLAKLKADPKQIDAIMDSTSEDPGRVTGDPYPVSATAALVEPFKNLALRLNLDEAGIVASNFGYHVMLRVAPPPPDPLESAAILARTEAEKTGIWAQVILIGWKGHSPDMKGTRTKAEADKIAKETLDKANAKEDFGKLMKEVSDDTRGKDNPTPHELKARPASAHGGAEDPIEKMALRLKMDETGMVKSKVGWVLVKRVAEPPPDPLTSTDIMKRTTVAPKVSVKHILLGWTDVHADDPRGAKRTRAELEKLVKDTVAKLKKGDKIEPLMKELSEDPGSKEGTAYPVSPGSGMVEPFETLSLRLNKGEVGIVKTQFGIHIIQRTE